MAPDDLRDRQSAEARRQACNACDEVWLPVILSGGHRPPPGDIPPRRISRQRSRYLRPGAGTTTPYPNADPWDCPRDPSGRILPGWGVVLAFRMTGVVARMLTGAAQGRCLETVRRCTAHGDVGADDSRAAQRSGWGVRGYLARGPGLSGYAFNRHQPAASGDLRTDERPSVCSPSSAPLGRR